MSEEYDRGSSLKALPDSKAGVKGLVDAGIMEIPIIFIDEHRKVEEHSGSGKCNFSIPVIDLDGIQGNSTRRCEIVDKVRDTSEKWGIFQIVNHGISADVMDEMMNAVREFHEQDSEVKKQFCSRDHTKSFVYDCNLELYGTPANWRDNFQFTIAPHPSDQQDAPVMCRDILLKYSKYVKNLGLSLSELLSEALGLRSHHLKDMLCAEELVLFGHYYPACPTPELTLGTREHTDGPFLTILLQDQIGGLQVLHKNQWVDVPFFPGALTINVGDVLQLITNDKFKSMPHRVLANKIGPRISVACFLRPNFQDGISQRLFGPIKELLSKDNTPIYPEMTFKELIAQRNKRGLDGRRALSDFRLNKQTMGN